MKINLDDATPGVVLKDPAVNHQGQVLLPAGAELDAKKMRILRSWGIRSVEVEDHAGGAPDASEIPASAKVAEVQDRFRRVRDDPLMDKLLGVLVNRIGGES
jgi:hypothetical protein